MNRLNASHPESTPAPPPAASAADPRTSRMARVSLVVATRDRNTSLAIALASVARQSRPVDEIIIVDNGSAPDVQQRNAAIASEHHAAYIALHHNAGVSGGRNVGLERATGDVIVELDDDAEFLGEHAIAAIVEHFQTHPRTAVIACKIIDGPTQRVGRWELPFLDKNRDVDLPGFCAWFIGAGHAFRRDALSQIGLYRDFAPWGEEEQDLSFRVINAGFDLYYLPAAAVLHHRVPAGRMTSRWRFGALHLKHKLKAALLNLPWTSVASYVVVRGLQLTWRYRDPRVPFLAAWLLWKDAGYIRAHRRRISRDALRRLSALRGHRYY